MTITAASTHLCSLDSLPSPHGMLCCRHVEYLSALHKDLVLSWPWYLWPPLLPPPHSSHWNIRTCTTMCSPMPFPKCTHSHLTVSAQYLEEIQCSGNFLHAHFFYSQEKSLLFLCELGFPIFVLYISENRLKQISCVRYLLLVAYRTFKAQSWPHQSLHWSFFNPLRCQLFWKLGRLSHGVPYLVLHSSIHCVICIIHRNCTNQRASDHLAVQSNEMFHDFLFDTFTLNPVMQ